MASIRKRDDKWQVQVRRVGQSSFSRSFAQKADARKWARHVEACLDRGEDPLPRSQASEPTIGDLLRRYQSQVSPTKRCTALEADIIRCLEREPFCLRRHSELTVADVIAYRDRRLGEVSAPTVRRALSLLQTIIDHASTEWGYELAENPVRRVRKPKDSPPRDRRLRVGEEGQLMASCGQCENPWIKSAVILALETGMRRGELLRARWEHLDTTKRTLLIPETKNGHPRTIPLSTEALALLDQLPRHISGRIIPITATALRQAWDRALRRAGIDDLHFHDLRHEAISRFFERGLSVPEVALISGHRDYRMLFRYTHLRAEDVARKLAT